jgi:hypothetical protein
MASSYKNLNLFGSGPHRFTMRRLGQLIGSPLGQPDPTQGSAYLGLFEIEVVIAGRLVATSDSALWTIRNTITAQLLNPPVPGTLIDHTGKSYADMSFVRFEVGDRTDRGRVVSIEYTAVFLDFKVYPQ